MFIVSVLSVLVSVLAIIGAIIVFYLSKKFKQEAIEALHVIEDERLRAVQDWQIKAEALLTQYERELKKAKTDRDVHEKLKDLIRQRELITTARPAATNEESLSNLMRLLGGQYSNKR